MDKKSPAKQPQGKKPNDRLERLREWQKAREEAKAKMAKSKKPVFSVRQVVSKDSVVARPHHQSFSAKSAILSTSPKKAVSRSRLGSALAKKPTTSSKPTGSSKTYSTKNTILKMSPRPAKPAASASSKPKQPKPPAPSKPVEKPLPGSKVPKKPAREESSSGSETRKKIGVKEQAKPTVRTRQSARIAEKQAKQPAPAKTAPSTRSTAKTAAKSVSTKTTKAVSKKATPKKKTGRKATPGKALANNEAGSKKRVRKSPVQEVLTEVEPEPAPVLPVPTTPKKTYEPVHPSPLLNCRSASRTHVMVYNPMEEFVDEPAWIPGAQQPQTQTTANPNFESVFGSNFSPFKFTAGSSPSKDFQFDFCMDLKEPVHAPAAGSEMMLTSPDSLANSDSTNEPNSSYTSAPASSVMEDLITFSDTSNCSMSAAVEDSPAPSTPTLRRSLRNIARKSYSSQKQKKAKSSSEGDSTSAEDITPNKSGKRSHKMLTDSADSNVGSSESSSHSLRDCTPSEVGKSLSESRRQSHLVGAMEGGLAKNLEQDYDKENSGSQGMVLGFWTQGASGIRVSLFSFSVCVAEEAVDFRKLHSDVCEKLSGLCEVWERKERELDESGSSQDIPNLEDGGYIHCCRSLGTNRHFCVSLQCWVRSAPPAARDDWCWERNLNSLNSLALWTQQRLRAPVEKTKLPQKTSW